MKKIDNKIKLMVKRSLEMKNHGITEKTQINIDFWQAQSLTKKKKLPAKTMLPMPNKLLMQQLKLIKDMLTMP